MGTITSVHVNTEEKARAIVSYMESQNRITDIEVFIFSDSRGCPGYRHSFKYIIWYWKM